MGRDAGQITEGVIAHLEGLEQEEIKFFLNVICSDGEHFTVGNGSIFDYMTGESKEYPDVQFSEEYETLNKAKKI